MRLRTLTSISVLTCGITASGAWAGELEAGLVVLSSSEEGALTINGNGRTEAVNLHVNSSAELAVVGTGNAVIQTPELRVNGGTSFTGNAICTGPIASGAEPVSEPFMSVGAMIPDPSEDKGGLKLTSGLHLVHPGHYSKGISINGKASVQLLPGVYTVGGKGLNLTGGMIVGQGVVFVILEGAVTVSGQAVLTLSGPTSGTFEGITIYQPASNSKSMSLTGGSGMTIYGAICAPSAHVKLTGSSTLASAGAQMGDFVVADTVHLAGNGVIKIGQGDSTPMESIYLPGAKLMYD